MRASSPAPAAPLPACSPLANSASSCYSAHEHTHLFPAPSATADPTQINLPKLVGPQPTLSISTLPTDITIEVLFALFLLTTGIVLSAEPLKPIRWREWAADVDHGPDKIARLRREGDHGEGEMLYNEGGYSMLDAGKRMGFLDIRKRRKEFAEWVRHGGPGAKG